MVNELCLTDAVVHIALVNLPALKHYQTLLAISAAVRIEPILVSCFTNLHLIREHHVEHSLVSSFPSLRDSSPTRPKRVTRAHLPVP